MIIRAWFVALPYHTPEMAAVFAARPALRRRIAKLRPTADRTRRPALGAAGAVTVFQAKQPLYRARRVGDSIDTG